MTSALLHTIALRRAKTSERGELSRLAALESAQAPRGDVLVAEVECEIWAAISIIDGVIPTNPIENVYLARPCAGPHSH